MGPLVSVIIPTKNRADWLLEAVASIQSQTCPEWEVIIVDDGTAEKDMLKVKELLDGESRCSFKSRVGGDAGAPVCRNQGLQLARGDYVVFLDDDDALAPTCLENRVSALGARPDLDFLVTPCQAFCSVVGDTALIHNIETDQDALDRFICLDTPWPISGPLWRRESLERVGPWNERLPSFQDWDFHVRALVCGLRYEWNGKEPDCYWRLPAASKVTIGGRSQSAEHLLSHLQLFCGSVDLLRNANLLSEERKVLFSALFFWLAESWLRLGQPKQALSVWEQGSERLLLAKDVYASGATILRSKPQMLLRRVLRKVFTLPYPQSFCAGDYSKTYRRNYF